MVAKRNKIPSEQKIVRAVVALFKRKGYKNQQTEVQFCERFVDMLCWKNPAIKEVVAIEAKVNAPTRAFEQASRYRYIADYVYVAILKNGCNKKSVELAETTGIGLIFVKRDSLNRYHATIEINPQKSIYKDKNLTRYILRTNFRE